MTLRFLDYRFQEGDLLACYGAGWARLISLQSCSLSGPPRLRLGPSHVAMILGPGRKLVESTSLCEHPCDVAKRRVSGVQVHDPRDRINDYVFDGGRVDVYRMTPWWRFNTEQAAEAWALVSEMLDVGTVYDFFGAGLSGTRLFQLSRFFPSADLSTVFCSELIAALLMRFGRAPFGNATRFNPGRLMRSLVNAGVYKFHNSFEAQGCGEN